MPPLYTNTFYLWLDSGVGSLLTLLFWTVVARVYSAEEVGLGAVALASLTLLAWLADLGLGFRIIRFLPQAGEKASWLLNSSFTPALLASFVASLVFLLGLPFWSPRLLFLHRLPFLVLVPLVTAALTLGGILDLTFLAYRTARFVLLKHLVNSLLRIPLMVALVGALGHFSIVAATGLAEVLALVLGFWLLRRLHPGYRPGVALAIPGSYSFAVGNYFAELFLAAPNLLLPMLVLNLLGGEAAGYFYLSWFMGFFVVGNLANLALSLFVEGSHQPAALLQLARRGLLLAALAAVAAVGGVFLLGDVLLLLLGREYSLHGLGLLQLMVVAALPASLTRLYLGVERVRQRMRLLLLTSGVVAGLTLVVSYLLLPRMGIAGAGVGLLAGYGVGAAIALVQALRVPGLAAELLKPSPQPQQQAPLSPKE